MQKKKFYLFEKLKKRKEKKSISTHPIKKFYLVKMCPIFDGSPLL
jgi:hypothetical protein